MENTDPTAAAWNWTKSVQLEDGTKLHILRLQGGLIAEVTLAKIYIALAEAKLLQVVWPGGAVTLSWWMQWMSEKNADGTARNVILTCFVQKDASLEVVGFGSIGSITLLGWINGEPRYKSEVGFSFLPSVHRSRIPYEFGEMMADYAFEGLRNEVIYGTTPKRNVMACRYAERVGLKVLGVLPIYGPWTNEDGSMEPCDYQVAALTREQWEKARQPESREMVEA
jgi:RimJ/RimL family protein N-acetyltransferase